MTESNNPLNNKSTQDDHLQTRAIPPSTDPKVLDYLYPKNLKLEQLIVINRHGDRTPLKPRFPSLFPLQWNFCHRTQQQLSYVSQFDPNQRYVYSQNADNQVQIGFKKSYEHIIKNEKGQAGVHQIPQLVAGTCGYGHLTDVGYETMYHNGDALRKIYVDHLKFLPDTLSGLKPQDIYLRSTDYHRTFESLQQLLLGTFPNWGSKDTPDVTIRTRSHDDETMFPNWRCNELNRLIKQFRTNHRSTLVEKWESLRKDLLKVPALSGLLDQPEYKSYFTIHQLFDSFISARSHQIPLPTGLTDKHLRELEKLEVGIWFDMFETDYQDHSSTQLNRFCIGGLFKEVKQLMESKVNETKLQSAPKVAFFSGHDTTIGPFLLSLKAFDHRWPPYGSMLMIELFKDQQRIKDQHFVRVKYNHKVVEIPECGKEGNYHPEAGKGFCKLEVVKKMFDQFIVKDLEGECKGFKPEMSAV